MNQGLQIAISNRLKISSPSSKVYITIQYLNEGKEVEFIDSYSPVVCCNRDDVLMTRTGNTGIVITDVEGVFHNNFFKINYNKKLITKEHLVNFLRLEQTQRQILIKAGTSTIPDLNHNDFYSIYVVIPSIAEQEAIATALSDTDVLIESLEQLIAKKRQIKQGAMQELLTGKRRLPGFEIKRGYKHTEVGLIPEDWNIVTIAEVADKITVGFVGSMAHLFTNQGIPLLRGQNVLENKLDLSETKFISDNTHKMWKKSALQLGDVVMVRVGYPGTACVIPYELGEANAASLVVVRPSPKNVDSKFLSMVINSKFGKRQIDSYLVGGAQQVLNTTTAAIFKLPLPNKAEQTAIATILSDMDAEITTLEEKLVKTRQIKQGMMQELLTGRIRLV